jgi:hypothetical protein
VKLVKENRKRGKKCEMKMKEKKTRKKESKRSNHTSE